MAASLPTRTDFTARRPRQDGAAFRAFKPLSSSNEFVMPEFHSNPVNRAERRSKCGQLLWPHYELLGLLGALRGPVKKMEAVPTLCPWIAALSAMDEISSTATDASTL